MKSIYELCVDMLYVSFQSELSEKNYHDIVRVLHELESNDVTIHNLKPFYKKYNYPESYDPFKVMENLRFAYTFGTHNNDIDYIITQMGVKET